MKCLGGARNVSLRQEWDKSHQAETSLLVEKQVIKQTSYLGKKMKKDGNQKIILARTFPLILG